MNFDELITKYQQIFPLNGSFVLRKGERISEKILKEDKNVPDKPGVYVIYDRSGGPREVFCIGKAGTMLRKGIFTRQKLPGRLTAKQEGISRPKFYQKEMKRLKLDELVFEWFVTFDKDVRTIPAKAEAELIQAYFEQYGRLPEWNKRY